MTTTVRKVQLSLTFAFNDYKVVSVTNTTSVKPGEILQVAQVQKLCDDVNWEVTMVDPNIPGQIFNFIRSIIPIPAL